MYFLGIVFFSSSFLSALLDNIKKLFCVFFLIGNFFNFDSQSGIFVCEDSNSLKFKFRHKGNVLAFQSHQLILFMCERMFL